MLYHDCLRYHQNHYMSFIINRCIPPLQLRHGNRMGTRFHCRKGGCSLMIACNIIASNIIRSVHDPRLQMNRYKSSRVVCVLCWDVLLLWGGPQGKSNTSGPPTPHSLHLFQSVLLHACAGSEREHSPHEPKDNNQQDISGFIQMQSLSAGSCIMCTCRDRTHSVICSVRQHVYTPNMPCI